ncbi:MAG: adenylate/guanylate cyclase domain-containing protein [Candidatus Binatia bacterium]
MTDSQDEGPRQTRRLCGVLLADISGFSRLMGEDETRAMAALTRIREVFLTVVPRRGGTLDVQVGDCFVALFDSAVDAVESAIAIQTALASGPAGDPVRIRIGIHLGEVVRDGAEVFGDSINIASRLQTIARPGGIALSEDVYRAVRSRVDAPFRDMGPKTLKNIRDKIRVFEIVPDVGGGGRLATPSHEAAAGPLRPVLLAATGVAAIALLGLAGFELASRRLGTVAPAAAPAGAPPVSAPAAAPAGVTPIAAPKPHPTAEQPVVVGVMNIAARGEVPDWMRDVTRDGLNTILSKVTGVRVYSRQKIDFLRDKQGLSELEAAEKLGIGKMISGALTMDKGQVALELQVVDIASGLLDTSERVIGSAAELIELQNRLALNMLGAMNVALSAEERDVIFAKRTNDTLDGYRMLADTFGGAPPSGAPSPPPTTPRQSGSSWPTWPAVAWAEADGPDEAAIRTVLSQWAAALQSKNLDGVAAVSVAMDDTQRAALARYFENADRLQVSVGDLDVLVAGDEALVTFTRKDAFLDKRSGREMQLEVRLSAELARQAGNWKMRGIKKS